MRYKTIVNTGLVTLVMQLAACKAVVLNPSGDIAAQQAHLITVATCLLLLIIVPVIVLTLLFAWKYRSSNLSSEYTPKWDHSTRLEYVIWGAPLIIIGILSVITWTSTHALDPGRSLSRIAENKALPAAVKTLNVEVVALDWKWLFIYPDLGIATVNELATPIDTPVRFTITASSVMNSFYIPALAGQIYAMPGMQTTLNAVINKTGTFEGLAANYSGAGFSDMRFTLKAMTPENFDNWVRASKKRPLKLTPATYTMLAKPSIKVLPQIYGSVEPDLFSNIVNLCLPASSDCTKNKMPAMAEHTHSNKPESKSEAGHDH